LFGLPTDQPTIAERLKPLGYDTGIIGKWHEGSVRKFRPNRRGFDYFYGFLEGGSAYFPGDEDMSTIYENNKVVTPKKYLTFDFTDKAISFIGRHSANPFFLYLSYNAPHSPHEAPPEYLARFPQLTGERKSVAAMISAMDDCIGQLKGKLVREGLMRNTLIIFASDNGGVRKRGASSNYPFSGGKNLLWEGGVRIPMVMSYKGVLPRKMTFKWTASLMDLAPTILAAAGHPLDPLETDGVDLFPYLQSFDDSNPHRDLYWRFAGKGSVRNGKYKLLIKDLNDPVTSSRLFDLAVDPGEKHDISASEPQLAEAFRAKFNIWNASNIPPLW
jgi:arylsulfatase A-like enzyme